MRKAFLFLAAFAMACAVAGPASAATLSLNLPVSTTVPAVCTVSTTPLGFGDYADGKTGNGGITVKCTDMLPYTVSLNAGGHFDLAARNLNDGAGHQFQYLLYKDAARAQEWGDSDVANTYSYGSSLASIGTGADQARTVYGYLQPGGTGPAGTYTDTVLVTVTY